MGDNEAAGRQQEASGTKGERQSGPVPNWTAIFALREDLRPPGYAQVFIDCIDNPRIKPKQIEKEKIQAKKKKKKLGRGQSA